MSVLGIVSGAGGPVELPALQTIWAVTSVAYLAGGLLLGIAFFRAAILPRRAGALLAAGSLTALLVPLLPHTVERYAAVPVGLALVWLGAALWNEQRNTVPSAAAERRTTPLDVAAAE